jgi:hypothetical protein
MDIQPRVQEITFPRQVSLLNQESVSFNSYVDSEYGERPVAWVAGRIIVGVRTLQTSVTAVGLVATLNLSSTYFFDPVRNLHGTAYNNQVALKYLWINWNDGTIDNVIPPFVGTTHSHTYASPGTYPVFVNIIFDDVPGTVIEFEPAAHNLSVTVS